MLLRSGEAICSVVLVQRKAEFALKGLQDAFKVNHLPRENDDVSHTRP